jgi:uncharacterized protein
MNKSYSLVYFFILTFVFSWLVWIPAALNSMGRLTLPFPTMMLVLFGAHGPLVAALMLTYKAGRWNAVKALLRAGFDLRLKLVWWLVILSLPIALGWLAVWVSAQQNGFEFDRTLLSQPAMILPTFFVLFFFGGSFQEEFGWRGFALPKLLETNNPIIASLILGVIWGVWHYPLFHIAGASQSFMRFDLFLAFTTAYSFIFTWVYLKTNNNVFTALLLHTAINTGFSLFPPVEKELGGDQSAFVYLVILCMAVAVFLVLKDRAAWLKTSA